MPCIQHDFCPSTFSNLRKILPQQKGSIAQSKHQVSCKWQVVPACAASAVNGQAKAPEAKVDTSRPGVTVTPLRSPKAVLQDGKEPESSNIASQGRSNVAEVSWPGYSRPQVDSTQQKQEHLIA